MFAQYQNIVHFVHLFETNTDYISTKSTIIITKTSVYLMNCYFNYSNLIHMLDTMEYGGGEVDLYEPLLRVKNYVEITKDTNIPIKVPKYYLKIYR